MFQKGNMHYKYNLSQPVSSSNENIIFDLTAWPLKFATAGELFLLEMLRQVMYVLMELPLFL
jgi:hypothetical protein